MAVALERFSIREYAAKMRSVDFDKCWPFDGERKKGEAGSSLPPISVRKFRWWADDLKAVRSAQRGGEKPDETGGTLGPEAAAVANDKASKAPNFEEEMEEGQQMRTLSRGKQRAPKKRSIVELFAVAPPVEKAAGDEEANSGDGSEEEEAGVVLGEEKSGGKEDEENNLGQDYEVAGVNKEASETPRKRKERDEKATKKKKGTKEEKKKKKKKKKKKLKVEICAAKQDKILKPKMSFAIDISQLLQCSVHKKQFMKTLKCPVDRQKKKAATKTFPKKHKHIQTSKLISRKRKDVAKVLPIHSILKNRNRGLSMKKTSALGDALGSDVIKLCQDSAKHVSFSGKDDILGHKESCSPMELPQLRSLCKIFSDVLAASSAMNNPSKFDKPPLTTKEVEVGNDSEADVSTSVVEKKVGCLPEEQQVNDVHGHVAPSVLLVSSNRSHHETEKSFLVESVDLNHDLQSYDNSNCTATDGSNLSSNPYSGSQLQIVTHKENLHSDSGVHAEERVLRISDAGNLPPVGNHVARSDTVNSLTINRSTSQQSASCLALHLENNERQQSPSIDPKIGIPNHYPDFQQVGFPSPKDSVGSMCSSVGSKRFEQSRMATDPAKFVHLRMPSDPISLYREKCVDEDFVGLPLNSQGEFIKHSNSRFGFNELFKKHNMVLGSSYSSMDHLKTKGKFPGVAVYHQEMLNQFPEHRYPCSKMLTYSSGCIELQGYESRVQDHKLVKDKDFILQGDSDLIKVSCNGCRHHNQIHHCINLMKEQSQAEANLENRFQPAIQPTMRLMGKNVTVGRSSKDCQGLDNGKIWTDKEIITEDRPSVRVSDKALSKQEWGHRACGMPKGNFLQPLETQSSLFHLPEVCARSDLMNFDFRPQLMSGDGLSLPFRNHNPPLDSFGHPLPSHALLSEMSNSSINSKPASESVKMGHQHLGSHGEDVCQHMLLGSTHCKHSQSVSYSTPSTFHPSFQNHGYVSFAQPSPAHSSSSLPQWLLYAAQQTKNQKSSCTSYSNPISVHQSCNISGSGFFSQSSPYPTSVISFPAYGPNPSQACGSSIPASVVQAPGVPSFAVNNSSSPVSSSYQNKSKSRDGTKSSFTYFRGPDHVNRNRKRIAAKDDGFMRPAKKPTMKMHENINALASQGGKEQLHGYTQLNTRALDLRPCGSKTIEGGPSMVDIEKEELRTVPRFSSYKADGVPRSGPFKLSAGTKHILKPSQTTGHDNSKTVHSTVPFATGNSSGSVTVSQKKSAKIYRF